MRLLILQTAFIGDVVLTTPLIETLKRRWPGSEIHFVGTPQGCEVLRGLPGVVCHPLDKKNTGRLKGAKRLLESVQTARGADPFDAVISVHRSPRSLWIGKRIPARRHVAFRSPWARLFGYETVRYPSYDESVHYVDKPLGLLRLLDPGMSLPKAPRPTLAVDERDEKSLAQKLGWNPASRAYAVVSPFSVWGTKMWFADRFAATAAAIAKRGLTIVVVGSGGGREAVVGQTICEKVTRSGGEAVSLVGKTGLGELKALIRSSRLVLANDSAPIHFASAFDVPTVAVFGPTVRKWGFFPLSTQSIVVERAELACRPCHIHGPNTCPKRHFRCMQEIQVEHVLQAVEKLKLR